MLCRNGLGDCEKRKGLIRRIKTLESSRGNFVLPTLMLLLLMMMKLKSAGGFLQINVHLSVGSVREPRSGFLHCQSLWTGKEKNVKVPIDRHTYQPSSIITAATTTSTASNYRRHHQFY